jgi:glyoxylase-like metal-dependent hydrolase (beta-lactamase superfamily II)
MVPTFYAQSESAYKHFEIQTLAPGVYAAINRIDGHGICNAGIVDLGNDVLVFDTFLSLDAAAELKTAAERLTGKTVRHVVNSHHHNDHIRGNQLFTEATIYSTQTTRDLILQEEPRNVNRERNEVPEAITALKEASLHVTDSVALLEIQLGLWYNQAIYTTLPDYRITPPTHIVNDSLILHGPLNRVVLKSLGGGHTKSDLFLWIPDQKILFAGDLVFNGFHPWLLDGSCDSLNSYLLQLEQYRPLTIVPGHGRTGGPELIAHMLQYTYEIKSQMIIARQSNFSEGDYQQLKPSDQFKDWLLRDFYTLNILRYPH